MLSRIIGIGRLPALAAIGAGSLPGATIDLSRPASATLADLTSRRTDVVRNFAMITLGVSAGGVIAPFVFGYAIETVSAGTAFVATAAVDSLTRLLARGRTGAIVVVGMETQKRTDRIRGV